MTAGLPPQEIIRLKRDGGRLPPETIEAFVQGVVSGAVTDAQLGAFAMAAWLNGLDRDETVALTRAMTASGRTLDWSGLPGPALDKHSTGGIGDTVSLILAPALAACGAFVPMIAGRGLGHTGGTIDKLDAIPGYMTRPDVGVFRAAVRDAGCAIVGQTQDVAPADRRLYAARDVTATVESLPLITASILSKKLAAGLSALVLDVKTGSGAFMASIDDARALARSLVEVANGAGLKTSALLTDMDEPLAPVAGNALEILHAVEILAGRREDARLVAVTAALGGETLAQGGLAASAEEGAARIAAAISSGAAAERFARMVAALGGPSDLVDRPRAHLAEARTTLAVAPERPGVVAGVETRALGLAVVALGGGRTRAEDGIDVSVGLDRLAGVGEEVGPDRPLAIVHARDAGAAERAAAAVRAAYRTAEAAARRPLVLERIA
ncbi:thymidine phosphorylase [Chenggangzhangella methanolivorans]|uniref:Thymidine phosphorylase n=1 Tax=Chenggangzhangella methanolivorans TaxID=1437009 RepID=A0A9E6RET7_9HYPH|nr:thymidine phosphorylase [Chenggangzhangella methanolivorans]QZO02199.1 thymidine phosphorylase [Chenggangzhangella methanolivorans]